MINTLIEIKYLLISILYKMVIAGEESLTHDAYLVHPFNQKISTY